MQLKNSVKLQGISNELLLGLIIINDIFKSFEIDLVITSLVDSKHSPKSLHYSGNAVDIRTSNIPKDIDRNYLIKLIQQSLGPHFDVIDEQTHIHIEYQPVFLNSSS